MYKLAIDLVSEVMAQAVPVAVVIEVSNILVKTFLRAAFGGKLWFGS